MNPLHHQLAVVVLNYRTPELVINCVDSVCAGDSAGARVVIVDNASGDGSAAKIEAIIAERGWSEWVRLEQSSANGGFSAGNNIGILAEDADAFLLLNSDILVRSGAIEEMLRAMEAHPQAGLIAPRLEWPDGTPQTSAFRWPRPRREFAQAASSGPISRLFRSSEVALPIPDEPTTHQEWVSFAAVLIRREVIEQIGLMDEGFFMYFEDIDYCRRAREAGWDILYWPKARVVHLRGGSSPMKSLSAQRKRRPAYYYESRARYYAKFYGRFGLWQANIYWILGRCVSWLRELIQRKDRVACDCEWRDNWRNALNPIASQSSARSQT